MERNFRAKSERHAADLNLEVQALTTRLEEQGEVMATQVELSKRREAETLRIKSEMEENMMQNNAGLSTKHIFTNRAARSWEGSGLTLVFLGRLSPSDFCNFNIQDF